MNLSTRFALGFLSLCVPLAAAAAAPGSVTGITASLQGGKVLVTWNPLPDTNIVAYRVFFSHASILSSEGLYDDYDTVDGSVNSYTIVNTPQSDTVYVSVLAMNSAGEESPYFAEEASVKLSDGGSVQPTPVSSAMSSVVTASSAANIPSTPFVPTQSDAQLRLLSVRTLSATGVELTFSQIVSVDPATATQAFDIQSGSGSPLTMTRLSIVGNIVRIDTAPQTRGMVYAVLVGNGVLGVDPVTGATAPLDPSQAPMLFTGDPSGIAPGASATSSAASSVMPTTPSGSDVSALSLRATPEKKNYYAIQATWQAPADPLLIGFEVTQTTDRGLTFSKPSVLDKNTAIVSVPHVPAGSYGILVKAMYSDGSRSRGVLKTVDLPGSSTPLQGSVTGKPGTSGHLPQSGPGVLSVLVMLGSAAGYAVMKRRQQLAA